MKVERGQRIGTRVVVAILGSGSESTALLRCDCGHPSKVQLKNVDPDKGCRACSARHTPRNVNGNYSCSLCGQQGHNKRYCSLTLPEPDTEEDAPELVGVRCTCGEPAVERFRGQPACRDCLCQPWEVSA